MVAGILEDIRRLQNRNRGVYKQTAPTRETLNTQQPKNKMGILAMLKRMLRLGG